MREDEGAPEREEGFNEEASSEGGSDGTERDDSLSPDEELDIPESTAQGTDPVETDASTNTTVNVRADGSEHIHAIGSQVVNYFTETRASVPTRLKLGAFQAFSFQAIEARCQAVHFTEESLTESVSTLRRNRVLLIGGESEVGKGALAFSIAGALLGEHQEGRLYLQRNLEATINFDLKDLKDPEGGGAPYVVLLKDAFARGNRSLSRLGESLDADFVKAWGDLLTRMNCYVVLTADDDSLPETWVNGSRSFNFSLTPTAYKHPERTITERFSRPDSEWTPRAAATIYARLKTLPRSVAFVAEYKAQIESEDAVEDRDRLIGDALSQYENLERWFLAELFESHPAAWCMAVASVIGAADKATQGFPWIDAYSLSTMVAKHLRKLHPGWDPERKALAPQSELTLLAPARLEAVSGDSQIAAQPHLVTFRDPSYEERLWDVLTSQGRPLLTDLIPLLDSLLTEPSPDLRLAAASALGRIGEIDGGGIIYPIVRRLSESDRWQDHVSLGYLLLGALSTQKDPYIQAIVGAVEKYTIKQRQKRVAPYMLAMREVAFNDLRFAIDNVLEAVERHLLRSFVKFNATEKEWQGFVTRLSSAAREVGLWMDADARSALGQIATIDSTAQAFDKSALELINWASYALTGMCFGRGPIDVAIEVRRRLRRADDHTAAVAAFLMFKGDGVFDTLENFPAYVDLDGRRFYAHTPRVVVALADSPTSAEGFADFVISAYEALGSLAGSLSRWHRVLIVAYLERWAIFAVKTERGTAAIARVLKRIVNGPSPELAAGVSNFLRSGLFAKPSTPHAELAAEVRLSI
ncbi:MAG: hypothetical protein AAF493_11000 [Pseudomonadota bacterium]